MKKTATHYYFLKGWESNFNRPKNGITITEEALDLVANHLEFPKGFTSIKFPTTEHLFMWLKAVYFKDYACAKRIENTDSPQEAKDLGRTVWGFKADAWTKVSYEMMFITNLIKYLQNPDLAQKLKETGTLVLVEANERDAIWAVGLYEDDPRILDEKNWKGLNLLGKVLMQVRTALLDW